MVEGKGGEFGPPVHCFLEKTKRINGFVGDDEDAGVNYVVIVQVHVWPVHLHWAGESELQPNGQTENVARQ